MVGEVVVEVLVSDELVLLGDRVVVSVTVEVTTELFVLVLEIEPPTVTAVWACCPLPRTVTINFCPGTMP